MIDPLDSVRWILYEKGMLVEEVRAGCSRKLVPLIKLEAASSDRSRSNYRDLRIFPHIKSYSPSY